MENRVLFLADTPLHGKSGNSALGTMHYKIVNELFPHCINVIVADGADTDIGRIVYGVKKSSLIEKMESSILGFPAYLSIRTVALISKLIVDENIEIVYIDNSVSGHLIRKIKKEHRNIKVIVFFHDIEAELMKSQIKNANFLRKLSLKVMIKNERETVIYADRKIVLNKRDWNLYESIYQSKPNAIVPIVMEAKERNGNHMHYSFKKVSLLFVGVDYGPNVDGVDWFISEVAPRLGQIDFEFNIVGYGMDKYKEKWESRNDNVHVIGSVADLGEYYIDADIVIAPIYEGGGMKVKTAEAFSYGKIFIGMEESLIGYWEDMPEYLKNNLVFECNEPETFAETILSLYRKDFSKCNEEIKRWMVQEFSYCSNLRRYLKIFEE